MTPDHLRGGYEVNPIWVEIAESLKFVEDNRLKLQRLETQLEQMTAELDKQDVIDFECKVGEYRNLL